MPEAFARDAKKHQSDNDDELTRLTFIVLFGEAAPDMPISIAEDVENDRIRRVRGLPPRYGNYGIPGRLRGDEGSPVPAATTPKIFTGGDGSNHDPPVAGAAAIQRVRATSSEEQKVKQRILVMATT